MMRRLYYATLTLARSPHATPILAALAFFESIIFPIPPDVMLIPMMLAQRARAFVLAAVTTIASVLGACAAYALGALAFDMLGAPVLAFYGGQEAFARFTATYETYGAWVVGVAAISFIPFKIATLASGVVGAPLLSFVVAALVGRALRFFTLATLLYYFGKPIARTIDRYFIHISWAAIAALVLAAYFVLG